MIYRFNFHPEIRIGYVSKIERTTLRRSSITRARVLALVLANLREFARVARITVHSRRNEENQKRPRADEKLIIIAVRICTHVYLLLGAFFSPPPLAAVSDGVSVYLERGFNCTLAHRAS